MSEIDLHLIPDEMREADLASFPYSPGIMDGHYIFSQLYWFKRQALLKNESRMSVFKTNTPEPPRLQIPGGHIKIHSTDGLNQLVWNDFLEKSFDSRPTVNHIEQIRSLITVNARADRRHFEQRTAGNKSQIFPGGPAYSILRTGIFENRDYLKDNLFYLWLISETAQQIQEAIGNDFSESWTSELKALVLMWNAKFPDEPFIPKENS